MKIVRLKPGREKPLLRHHPWIFSGSVRGVEGKPSQGEIVEVHAHDDRWLARGAFSPSSGIRVRVWTWDRDQMVDAGFIRQRLLSAIASRAGLKADPGTDSYREVYAESDGLPGLIVDRYGSIRVVQFHFTGVEVWRETILDVLFEAEGCHTVVERSEPGAREQEGLRPRAGVVRGNAVEGPIEIRENGLCFAVDLMAGQKTGFYLDQRENRRLLQASEGLGRVLDCFCYTGGFALAALYAGAESVLGIDSSAPALSLARQNLNRNELGSRATEFRKEDVFEALRVLVGAGAQFDSVILDPPMFAATASQKHRAARGYKDINMLAVKLLAPGGRLFTFSCSGGVGPELFQKIVASAAAEAGVGLQVIGWRGQPADHPVGLNFPEGRYLKGLICRKFEL